MIYNKIKYYLAVSLFVLLSGNVFANKPIVGIGEITSNVGGNPQSFQTMLETAISQTNKFELMERSRMDDLLGEQALSAGGLTQGSGQIGGLSGIDYLVYGSITKLGTKSDAVAIGGFAGGGQKAEMSVDIRIVDTSTGSIRISKTVQKQASSGSAIAMQGFALGGEEADPLGKYKDLLRMPLLLFLLWRYFNKSYKRIKGQAYVNYGPPSVDKGMYLQIIELGEGFMDPDTGEMLGQDETYIGAIKITDVKSKFSIGTIMEGEIQRGAIASKLDKKKGKSIERKYKKKCKKEKNCLSL
ncbi:MAG: hypothetical protein CM15mP86_03100 [Gammaproteobacteria bacterium]|nr:MAG: hypothetical protein CM15mP86_03100 [Gammaproteobacteria bacterium]